MLTRTFSHLPGVGPKKEKRLWDRGIRSWDRFIEGAGPGPGDRLYRDLLCESSRRLAAGEPLYFTKLLPSSEHWRVFTEFRNETAYLDIETNGLAGRHGYITAISVYDGREVRAFVRGENLDAFPAHIERFKVLVTYNGRCFDVPFIENSFNIRLAKAHIDLRFVLASLGLRGGLKGCEKAFGMDRGELDGVDGFFAVLLWEEYRRTGRSEVLDTLLAYNVLDTVNLERLMVKAYNAKLRETPFTDTRSLPLPGPPVLPFVPDRATVERLKFRHGTAQR